MADDGVTASKTITTSVGDVLVKHYLWEAGHDAEQTITAVIPLSKAYELAERDVNIRHVKAHIQRIRPENFSHPVTDAFDKLEATKKSLPPRFQEAMGAMTDIDDESHAIVRGPDNKITALEIYCVNPLSVALEKDLLNVYVML